MVYLILFKTIILCIVITAYLSHLDQDNTAYAENRRHHKAHVHGQGKIDITFDSKKSTIEAHIEVPMEDLVGFEHTAKSDKEVAALKAAKLRRRVSTLRLSTWL